MKTTYQYKKIPIILLIFIGLGLGMWIGVGFSKSVGLVIGLVKWQKEVLLGSIALFVLLFSFRKSINLMAVNFDREIVLKNIISLFVYCALLGLAFNLLLGSVVFLLLSTLFSSG